MIDKGENNIDYIKLSIPNKAEYVSVVRLTTSAIASRMGFDIEEIEDIKVSIAEACTSTLENSLDNQNIDIEFGVFEDKLVISVKSTGGVKNIDNTEELKLDDIGQAGLGIFIINSLMDEVETINNGEEGTEIRMTKYIKDDIV